LIQASQLDSATVWRSRPGVRASAVAARPRRGQGPEHSSARIERFLVLCAEDNLRVAYPSTPASFFHLLRVQGRSKTRKPLVVFTPKSLLRAPYCVSTLDDLSGGRFLPVIDDGSVNPDMVRRVVITSGKVTYDLIKERDGQAVHDVAIVRLERYYPFPGTELAAALGRYPVTAELVWAQEEPYNMGAWRFIRERFLDGHVPGFQNRFLGYAGRDASASPAPGSQKAHAQEQADLIAQALG